MSFGQQLHEGTMNPAMDTKLRVALERVDRLAENNRLLILELEEKQALARDVNRRFDTLQKENLQLKLELLELKQRKVCYPLHRFNVLNACK